MAQVFNMAMARRLCDSVHGSGLDSDPWITQSKKNVSVYWDFHLLSEHGYYCGYWRFTVWIPKADPLEFRLAGRRGNPRTAAAYGLKDYLEERFADAMGEVLGGAAATAEFSGGQWRYGGSVDADV